MKIVDIFAPYLFAFWFDGSSRDEYSLAIDNWLDTDYLKSFYEDNFNKFIDNNDYFPNKDLIGFSTFIINNANSFDNKLIKSLKMIIFQNILKCCQKEKTYMKFCLKENLNNKYYAFMAYN